MANEKVVALVEKQTRNINKKRDFADEFGSDFERGELSGEAKAYRKILEALKENYEI